MSKKSTTRTTSFWMALVAIFISLVGTGISIMEAGILRDQQQLMAEEKAAAVWPFVVAQTNVKEIESGLEIVFTMTNKGVGPALINGFNLSVGEANGLISDVVKHIDLKEKNFLVLTTLNKQLTNTVIAAGETVEVYKLMLIKKNTTVAKQSIEENNARQLTQMQEVSEILEQITEEYCYCSIYGDCWNADNQPLETGEACSGREMLGKIK